jgi:orotidine-5'-phosphate decarboxylase
MVEPTQSVAEPSGTLAGLDRGRLRARLALALDVDDLVVATRMAQELAPWFGVAKVGLELFSATGSDSVAALSRHGYQVFLDLKLHDIPTTVYRAGRVLGALGVSFLTLHAHGGVEMMRAGVDGLAEGSSRAGTPVPRALAVTVLTSDPGAPDHVLERRVAMAEEAGCGGVVCAAGDVVRAKRRAPSLMAVVPGIRPAGTSTDDQARAATPEAALRAGADLLVIGRAVTAAEDPPAAAEAIYASLL